jgi:uncharacterized protein YlzI (FlbEa/FlbD family)
MIQLHRLNGKAFVVNAEHIKFIEATPDTLLTLVTSEVIQKVIDYKRQWMWKPLEEQRKA